MSDPPYAFCPYTHFFDAFDNHVSETPRGSVAYLASRNDSQPLIVAAQTNDRAVVNELLSQQGDSSIDINATGVEGETALHMASALGYIDVVKVLLDAGAAPNTQDAEGQTPLTHCARFCPDGRASEVASALLSAGADPAHKVTLDLVSVTALYFAISEHKSALAHILEPLTPRDLDVFPPEIGRNHIMDEAIAGADRHEDTSILEWITVQRQLLNPQKRIGLLARAVRDETFRALVKVLGMETDEVKGSGVEILKAVWAIDRRRVASCLRRLVTQWQLDVNNVDLREFVGHSRWPELTQAAQEVGMVDTVVPP